MAPKANAGVIMKVSAIPNIAPLKLSDVRISRSVPARLNMPEEGTFPKAHAYTGIYREAPPEGMVAKVSIIASEAPEAKKGMAPENSEGVIESGSVSTVSNADAAARNVGARLIRRLGIGFVNSVKWSPDGRFLAVGTVTGVHLVTSNTHGIRNLAESCGDDVLSVTFSPDGSILGGIETKLSSCGTLKHKL